jgi:hypothetical protein
MALLTENPREEGSERVRKITLTLGGGGEL